MSRFFNKKDNDFYKKVKKKLPSQKKQMKTYQHKLEQVLDIIEEGKEEFK